ncbi:enoyl-CoA hydratase/isomerase family protein, partial [Bradyrhizobium sp. 132]|uniref:enoyl-CoA hydratase/isomerase family protein n=2 Tax=unclassified Bradyrhizobium TaxID=2631580 RepID=UPI001FF8CDC3
MAIEHPRPETDEIVAHLAALGGAGAVVVDLPGEAPKAAVGVVRIGVHRSGPLPAESLAAFDILLSADTDAPRPWVGTARLNEVLRDLTQAIARQPVAAGIAAQVMRMTHALPFDHALALESLAFSMLLASAGFRTWREAAAPRPRSDGDRPRVRIVSEGPTLIIRLARQARRNAFDARMRDELCEALTFALDHPDRPPVVLVGEGPAFSAGGDLDEFGEAGDMGSAHLIRTLRSPAALVNALGTRLTAHLHGACIGAGIEVAASAARITARPTTVIRLPEVSMGLIPGAGGTAAIPRRIGRERACFLAISGAELKLATALAWGLV